MKRYLRFCESVNKAAMLLSIVLLVVTVGICFVQVVTRTAISFSFRWAEELTRYIVIYSVFLSAGTLLAKDEHPRVEILCNFLSPKTQIRLNYLYCILIFAFLCVLTYYGWQLVITSTRTWCSSIRIPWSVPFAAVFLGGINMLIQVPGKFIRTWLQLHEGSAA